MIEGIQSITFSVPYSEDKWSEVAKFYQDWGLASVDLSPTQQTWQTLNQASIYVVHADATQVNSMPLSPAIEAGPTLRQVVWGVDAKEDLNRLAQQLQQVLGFEDGRGHDQPFVSVVDPIGLSVRFEINQKKQLNIKGTPSNPWGSPQRINAASPIYDRAQPIEIGHVVMFVEDLTTAVEFYQSIGFVVSDRYPGRGAFMRCAAEAGHHDFFMLQIPNKAKGINHVAFTVRDIHEVFGGGMQMDRQGWKTQLGPGRHPVSSAYFWYFENPCGGLIEYNADEDHFTADWQPRDFQPSPTAFAEWAVDGGIDGTLRRQKQGPENVKEENKGKFITEKKS